MCGVALPPTDGIALLGNIHGIENVENMKTMMTEKVDTPDAAWFASVLDAVDDLILIKGPRSRLLWANRAFRECYGMSNEELRSLIDGQQSDPDDTLQYVRDDRRVFVERSCIDIRSEPVTDHLGNIRYFHTRKNPIFDSDGEVVMQVGVSRALADAISDESPLDLRERGHASTRNVRALVRSMPAPVVMLDAAHRVIMWNDAFADIVDCFSASEFHSSLLLHTDYAQTLEARLPLLDELDAIIHGARPVNRVLEVEGTGDWKSSFSVDCRTWTDASDVVSGTLAVFHDITEMLANERRLRDANVELAQFNYRVSHDIISPISSARGCLELAFDEIGGDDPTEMTELLEDVRSQFDRLEQLVMDLSSLARASAENPKQEWVDLSEVIDSISSENRDAAGHRITIDTVLAHTALKSEPARIRQVLSNLIDNATKYHDPEESERRIVVHCRREDDVSVIEVSDNGIGIDPEFGERAFEMFTRGGTSTQGSGLGLYIINKHMERLGGTLSIANNAKPTVVRLTIPDCTGATV